MKKIIICIIICLLLCGCSTNHSYQTNDSDNDTGYEDGYDAGYSDVLEESLNNPDYSDELRSFQSAIADLMYDHEYEIVKKLMEYNKEGVESALELEFGSRSIETVIEYLDNLSKTVKGTCEICNKPVYADDLAILPEGINCAHSKCISVQNDENSIKIRKDKS